jgi:hypothetical protein
MKTSWLLSLVAVLLLVGCASDKTLESLIPRNALAVVLVDHPALAVQALGSGESLPLRALDTAKPWAAAVVPANPPGFLLALALSGESDAWSLVQRWARDRGGLAARRIGSYAVLSSPGTAEPAVLDLDKQFDLSRVRAGGDPLAVYVDVKNLVSEATLPEALRPAFTGLPWAEKNLAGLRLGLAPKEGGLELRVATDWRPGSEAAAAFQGWTVPADPAPWTGSFPADGVALVASLPLSVWSEMGKLVSEASLVHRWDALAPLVGPRVGATVVPGRDGTFSWSLAVEARDPLAVRQALRTLVAGGELQKSFPTWALDADTPLIYRDKPTADGVRGTVNLGPTEVQVGYGSDRVVFSGGPGATEAWGRWKKSGGAAPWTGQAPPNPTALATGSVDGLGAKAAFRVLGDGNAEVRVWVDAVGLKAWEERLPQALLGWMSGEGGWTRWEP